MAWVVFATPPENKGWNFQPLFFPHKFGYKKDAKLCEKQAIEEGGRNVAIFKVDRTVERALAQPLHQFFILLCRRDEQVFWSKSSPDTNGVHQNTNYDPAGDRYFQCPRCSRRYYYCNGGEAAEGRVGVWWADRPLLVLHDPSYWKRPSGEETSKYRILALNRKNPITNGH